MEKIFKEAESKCTEKKWAETIYKEFFNEAQIETETIKDFTVVVYKNKIGYAKWNGIQPKHRCIGFAYAFYRAIGRKIPKFYKFVKLGDLPDDAEFYIDIPEDGVLRTYIKVKNINDNRYSIFYNKNSLTAFTFSSDTIVYIKEG